MAWAAVRDLRDLGLDLAKTCRQGASAGAVGNQDARGPHDWIDDIARSQEELLDAPVDTGPDEGLVQIDLCFGLGGLGAGFFGRQQSADAYRRGLFCRRCGVGRIPAGPPTATSSFSMSRCGTMPGLRFCSSRLTSSSSDACYQRPLGFLKLGLRLSGYPPLPPACWRRLRRSYAWRTRSAASCLELSSLKITSPFLTGAL